MSSRYTVRITEHLYVIDGLYRHQTATGYEWSADGEQWFATADEARQS